MRGTKARRRTTRALAAGLAGALLVPAAAAADPPVPPAELVAQINAYRVARGAPPVVLDERLAATCQAHVDYMLANGGAPKLEDSHTEVPGRPGYSEAGKEAAGAAIIGFDLMNGGRPFDRAPAHLYYFLTPHTVRVGPAERTDTVDGQRLTQSCLRGEPTDATGSRRAPALPPRLTTYPQDRETGVQTYLSAAEYPAIPAYEVGFVKTLGTPYLAGQHVMLWHDDVAGRSLEFGCASTLLAPGGRAVNAPTQGHLVVPQFPLLAGATYRTIATMSTGRACGDLQRLGSTSFTTAPRLPDSGLLRSGEPYAKDGKIVAESELTPALQLVRGEIEGKYLPGGYSFRLDGSWEYLSTWQLDNMDVGGTFQVTYTSRRIDLGPSCLGAMKIVASWTKNADGYTRNPVTVEHVGDPECDAPPTPSAPVPASGGPGTVVRLAGGALATATAVTFGGVPATAWTDEPGALRVTVPTGARSGPVVVTTPTGSTTAGTFTAGADTAAPDTRIDLGPQGDAATTTASFAFAATEAGAALACSVDGAAFRTCTSPVRIEGLAVGAHRLVVRATDAAGHADATPAVREWRVTGSSPAPAPIGPVPAADLGGTGLGGPADPGGGGGPQEPPREVRPAGPVLDSRLAVLRRAAGRLALGTLTLPKAARVRVTATLTVRGRRVAVRSPVLLLAARRGRTLAVVLPRAVRRGLPRSGRVTVRVTTRITPLPRGSLKLVVNTLKVRVAP